MLDFLRRQLGYGNELNSKAKQRARLDLESSPLLQSDETRAKPGRKLKIVMRKDVASRLLLKCKYGGALELEDVARDLELIPGKYVRVLSYKTKDE